MDNLFICREYLLFFDTYHPTKNFPYPEHIDTISLSSGGPTKTGQANISLGSPFPVSITRSSLQFFEEK